MGSTVEANEEQKRRGYEEEQKGFLHGWGGGNFIVRKGGSVGCLLTFLMPKRAWRDSSFSLHSSLGGVREKWRDSVLLKLPAHMEKYNN